MQCRQCGTEIADKALICYRCGTATTEAKFKPVVAKRSTAGGLLASVIVLALLVLCALYLGRVPSGGLTREISWVAVAAAAVIVVWLAVRRRH